MEQLTSIIRDYLPWLLSCLTIYMTLLAGNKHRHAWAWGLLNQALWLIWILVVGAYGLLPMNAALWILYARNHLKWSAKPKPPSESQGMWVNGKWRE